MTEARAITHLIRITDDWQETSVGASLRMSVERFRILRRTPKGCWIEANGRKAERFVLDGNGKRFAYPTLELAMDSYRIRKRRQIQYLAAQLERAEGYSKMAEATEQGMKIVPGVFGLEWVEPVEKEQ